MTPRIDRLRVAVWTALLALACAGVVAVAWLVEQVIVAYGPWAMAHARAIFVVVCVVCLAAMVVLARKDRAL